MEKKAKDLAVGDRMMMAGYIYSVLTVHVMNREVALELGTYTEGQLDLYMEIVLAHDVPVELIRG